MPLVSIQTLHSFVFAKTVSQEMGNNVMVRRFYYTKHDRHIENAVIVR